MSSLILSFLQSGTTGTVNLRGVMLSHDNVSFIGMHVNQYINHNWLPGIPENHYVKFYI